LFAESLIIDPQRMGGAAVAAVSYAPERPPYHIGLPVRGKEDGDGQGGSTREVIERAADQVVRGVNGFADFLNRNRQIVGGHQRVVLLPVVFTTAALYASGVDLAEAKIVDGNLPAQAEIESVPWIWFQYHVSSSLRHQITRAYDAGSLKSLGDVLHFEHSRSIAIVSVTGIEKFMLATANLSTLLRPLER
jgi:hypothetical protein